MPSIQNNTIDFVKERNWIDHAWLSNSREVTDAAKEIDRVVSAMAISADSATTKDPLQHHFNSEEYENEGL